MNWWEIDPKFTATKIDKLGNTEGKFPDIVLREYFGQTVYRSTEDYKNDVSIKEESTLKVGDSVVILGFLGLMQGKIIEEDNKMFFESGGIRGMLEFAKDGRKCWVVPFAWNHAALKEFNFE